LSTSDRTLSRRRALGGLIRVVHPFPSVLDAVAATTIALIAGAQAGLALRLGLGMLGVQFGIGAVNDFADSVSDAVSHGAKPIPAGVLSRRTALGVGATSAGLGLLTAATAGVGAFLVGALGLADGLLYDLRLKGTPLGWMPFAAGVGLLPLYSWWGAQGSLEAPLMAVATLAALAGATLALANAFADLGKDRAAGVASVAVLLGERRTLMANAVLLAVVQLLVVATTCEVVGVTPVLAVEAFGFGLGWVGVGLAGVGGPYAGPIVWEVQAVGVLVLGAGWLAALGSAGVLRG
jgi:4-hydroxybenzoate polyprenyltransferase